MFSKNLKNLLIISFALIFFGCVNPSTKLRNYYNLGLKADRSGDAKLAVRYYKKAMDFISEKKEIKKFYKYYYFALINIRMGNKTKTLSSIENISLTDPKYNDRFLLLKAYYFKEKSLNNVAMDICELLLKSKDENILIKSFQIYAEALINSYHSLDEKVYKKRFKNLTKALEKNYIIPELHYYYSNVFLKHGDYIDALNHSILSLEFGAEKKIRKDLIYTIKYLKTKLDKKTISEYNDFIISLLRRFNETNH